MPDPHAANLYYIHNDHLGTPKALTDEGGTKVWSATHTPFGEATVNEDPDGDGRVVVFNLRFPGQYYDGETGLHYNYFRYYDPSIGRYITSDPVGFNGGLNTFSYAANSPLMMIDPDGLRPCPPDAVPEGTPCWLDEGDGQGSGYPNEGRCATAQCAADIPSEEICCNDQFYTCINMAASDSLSCAICAASKKRDKLSCASCAAAAESAAGCFAKHCSASNCRKECDGR